MEDKRAKCALLVLCGLPGSGKTTIAERIRKHASHGHAGLVPCGPRCRIEIVTFDDWLHSELAAGEFSPEAWQRSRRAALAHLLPLLQQHSSQGDGTHTLIIADDNHHLRSMRHQLFQAARDLGAAFLQLHVPCSPRLALARNQRRSGAAAVPAEALLRMAEALEPPQPERFEWEACSLILAAAEATEDTPPSTGQAAPPPPQPPPALVQQTSRPQRAHQPLEQEPQPVAELCRELWRLWGPAPPAPPSEEELRRQREAGRAANTASYLHGLDLRSRRALAEAVAAATSAEDRAAVARRLNEQRRALLQWAREALQGLPKEGCGSGDAGSEEQVLARLREREAAFMRTAGT